MELRQPAQGTEGYLMRSLDGFNQFVFRVYHDNNGGFTDYDIAHTDLHIKIMDKDSCFYDGKVLDHSPETLGLQKRQCLER